MSNPLFLLIITPGGDRMIRNVADIRYVRMTQTATGELAVFAKMLGDGPDAGEKMLCIGPDSKDYFDWFVEHDAIDLMNIWVDRNEQSDEDPIELGTEDQEE